MNKIATIRQYLNHDLANAPYPFSMEQIVEMFPEYDEYDIRAALCEAIYLHEITLTSARKFVIKSESTRDKKPGRDRVESSCPHQHQPLKK